MTARLRALACALTGLLALAVALTDSAWMATGASLALLAFVVLGLRELPPALAAVGALLCICGLAAGGFEAPFAMLLEAALRTGPFVVLFAAVALLQRPALASRDVAAVGRWLARQPPGRRFFALSGGGHAMGAVLNLAGMGLVASFLPSDLAAGPRRRLLLAIARGFHGAVCWSPLFVGMVAVLSVLPQLSWGDLLPYGLVSGLLVIACAFAADRLARRGEPATPAAAAAPGAAPGGALPRVLVVFLLLALLVGAGAEGGGLPVSLAIGLVAPPFALLWRIRLAWHGGRAAGAAPALVRDSVADFPGLSREATLFLAANLFGLGLAQLAATAEGGWILQALAALSALGPVGLALAGVLLAAAGLHPVVFVVAVGHLLSPAALGVPATVLGATLLLIWGLGTAASPFSATNMQISRLSGASVFTVAWRWNAGFAVATVLVCAALLSALARALA